MDMFPKFIIEDGNLIISKCAYHKELVVDKEKVQGGGWFSLKDGVFRFYGDSYEFGAAKLEDIQKAVKEDKVFTNKYTINSIVKYYKFVYDSQSELIPLN